MSGKFDMRAKTMKHNRPLAQIFAAALIMFAILLAALPVHARDFTFSVKQPDTEYTETTVDMRVKVLGGEVRLDRTWLNGRWYLNTGWANLRFIADPLDDSIQTVDRAGTLFQRSGDSGLYVFNQVFIRKTDSGWRWYDRKGNWITYDEAGRMTGYGNRNDVKVNFVLDGEGRRTGVTDHHGQTVYTFSYDAGERLIRAVDRTGRSVGYEWQGDRLVKVTDVLGNEWHYAYDGNGQLNQRTEPDGGIIKIAYASSVPAAGPAMMSGKDTGRIEAGGVVTTGAASKDSQIARVGAITDKTGAVTLWNLRYDRVTLQYTITEEDPLGKQTSTVYDAKGRMLSRSVNGILRTTMVRDGDYLTKTIDQRGLTTAVEYDHSHNPVKIIGPDGARDSFEYDGTFDNPIRYTNALGNRTEWSYNVLGNLTQVSEAVGKAEQRDLQQVNDSYGQPVSFTVGTVTQRQTYDQYGNVATFTDGNGHTYTFGYNIQGQLASVTNPLNHTWSYAYDAAGYLLTSTDPLGHIRRYRTDAFGRVAEVTDALGHVNRYSYTYDNNGLTITETNALNQTTAYQYDLTGKLLGVTSPSGLKVQRIYDSEGRVSQLTDPAGNVTTLEYGAAGSGLDGLLVAAAYPTFRETYKYNSLGLPTQVSRILDAQSKLTSFNSYDVLSQTVGVTDPAGRIARIEYDALGNPVKHTDASGGQILQAWDKMGNVTRVTDPKGNTHTFEYDGNGNLIKEIMPSGKLTGYVYDAAGQLIKRTDAAGNVTEYQYDMAGRLITKTYTAPGQSNPEQTVSYVYNDIDQLIEVVQSGNTTTHYLYTLDVLGRRTQEAVTYGTGDSAFTKTLRYGYTADGQLQSITYPDGSLQTYIYENGQLKTVTLPDGQNMTWDEYVWQRPTRITMLGMVQTFSYDALQRTQSMSVNAGNTTLLNRSYVYDAAGNIIRRETEEGEFNYSYDPLDRLTQVQPPQNLQNTLPVESYAYDAVHNRIGSAHQPGEWLYNEDNQLLQYGTGAAQTTHTYTATGHIATETRNGSTLSYGYDAADRLSSVSRNGAEIARYHYDPMGRRISKAVNGQTTYYLYVEEGLLAELDEQGQMRVAYGWQPESMYGTRPLWQANLMAGNDLQTATYHYLHTDHLGTVQVATNQAGQITWRAHSEAFGKTFPSTQNLITMNLRFPGQYYDSETGTNYNYFRDYNPIFGRYMQKDPIGLMGGINEYQYVMHSPMKWIDSFGLQGWAQIPILNPSLPGNRAAFNRAQSRAADMSIIAQPGAKRLVTLCQALRLMRNNPNIYTNGSDLYTNSITMEDQVGLDLGIQMLTSDGYDLQYFLISYSATNTTNFVGGALSASFLDSYSAITGAISARKAHLDNKIWGWRDYYNELREDMRGTAAGYTAGNMGLDAYIKKYCDYNCGW